MISEIVERTKEPMHKVCKKINADEFLQPAKELWYDTFSARSIERAAMSLNISELLLRTIKITFHDHKKVRLDFLKDMFARMR